MAVAEKIVGEMLKEALQKSNTPAKSIAQDTNYSVDAIYAAINGKRKIPKEARQKIAEVHPLAGLAIAYQETKYRCFTVLDGDKHPQNVLQKALKEDSEADQALQGMGWRLIDKMAQEDLTEEDYTALIVAARELIDRIRADLSLLITWEDKYQIGLTNMLLKSLSEKEKAAIKTAR